MDGPGVQNGWLMVPFSGPEECVQEISVDGVLTPAYLDWAADGTRVAMITVPGNYTENAEIAVYAAGTLYGTWASSEPQGQPTPPVTGSVTTSQASGSVTR